MGRKRIEIDRQGLHWGRDKSLANYGFLGKQYDGQLLASRLSGCLDLTASPNTGSCGNDRQDNCCPQRREIKSSRGLGWRFAEKECRSTRNASTPCIETVTYRKSESSERGGLALRKAAVVTKSAISAPRRTVRERRVQSRSACLARAFPDRKNELAGTCLCLSVCVMPWGGTKPAQNSIPSQTTRA